MKTRILIPPGLWFRETPATNTVVPSEYMKKKLTLVKSQIITWFNHQLLHKKSAIALWFLCTLWLYTIQYIYIYTYIFSKSNPKQEEKQSPFLPKTNLSLQLPFSYRCFALRCIDAVDQRNTLTSGHWGHNSREGLGRAGISGCLRWLECVQSHFGEPFRQPKMANEFLFLSLDHCNSIAVNSMLQW